MADAFMDQKRQRDRLEEALENIRNGFFYIDFYY